MGRSKRSLFSENNLSLRPERLLGMTGSRMVGGGGGFFIPRLLSQLLPAIVFSNKDCLCVFFLSFFLNPLLSLDASSQNKRTNRTDENVPDGSPNAGSVEQTPKKPGLRKRQT